MMERMVLAARAVARAIRSCDHDYLLLPESHGREDDIHIVVLFRAVDEGLNKVLVQRINEGNEWYVSGTSWGGKPAVRVAVSSWRADPEDAFRTVRESLVAIARAYARS